MDGEEGVTVSLDEGVASDILRAGCCCWGWSCFSSVVVVSPGVGDKEEGSRVPSLVEGRDLRTEVPRAVLDDIFGYNVSPP
jgi:hypothetical protein